MCGNALFLKLQRLKDDHVRQGHYYLEYLKFTCEPTCEFCEREGWSAGVPGNWFPVPTRSNTTPRTYIPSVVPREEIDSLLPSIQVKRLFATGRRVDRKEVQKLCNDFLIDVNACNHFIGHQKFLAMKAKIMNNQTIRKLTIMKNKVSRCSSSLTTQWNALQYGE